MEALFIVSVVGWKVLQGLLRPTFILDKRETASSVNNVKVTGGRMTEQLATL